EEIEPGPAGGERAAHRADGDAEQIEHVGDHEPPPVARLSNSNTRQACGVPSRRDATCAAPAYSGTTALQNATPPLFPSDTRTNHDPGSRSHRRNAAFRPTPARRWRRSTKNSARSRTFGSSDAGEPRVTSAKPARRSPSWTRNAKRRSG